MAPQTMASFRLTTIGGAVMENSGGRQMAVASPAQVSRTGDKKKHIKQILWCCGGGMLSSFLSVLVMVF